ncbi:MAG: rod shape-determining protein RodA [Verrucomicrobiae bacterium]|nr:rod shape-determining protein RodA [Verrucomicrobiae bacterium]MDW7981033.1 rod shape-determining protein RodA [Verrucomicrobiales bacterium]
MVRAKVSHFFAEADRLQLAAVAALMALGVAFVYSATMAGEPLGLGQQFAELRFIEFVRWLCAKFFFKQAVWYGVGVAAALAICLVDYRVLARWAFVIYWVSIVLLVAVLVPGVGAVRYGARRWIDLGALQFQPTEFAKMAVILALAHYLSRPKDELKQTAVFAKAVGMLALPFVLILKEPDLGSAVVLVPTVLAMLYAAGAPARLLRLLLGGICLLGALFVIDVLFAPPNWQIKLQDYQRRRLLVYFGRDYTPPAGASQAEIERLKQQQLDDTYHVRQALISVGSGGLTGKGFCKGTQNALGYLPRTVAHNDFIFSVIAEEKGFIGSVTVLVLYGVVLLTGLRIAARARDRLGRLLAVGIVTLLFSQMFINIGMNIRLMPVTGVPLPLLSYGGSAVVSTLIGIGLLQNVYVNRKGY